MLYIQDNGILNENYLRNHYRKYSDQCCSDIYDMCLCLCLYAEFTSFHCLANMANDRNTQIQAILHGSLPSLIRCISDIDPFLRNSARICIGNLAANKANCNYIMNQGAFKDLIIRSKSESLEEIDFSAFAISNLLLNSNFLDQIGRNNGINPLLYLISSSNECCKCLVIVSLRWLFICSTNREQLFTHQFLEILSNLGSISNFEIQWEVVIFICDLTLVIKDKQFIIKCCFSQLVSLLKSDDTEITQFSVSALVNLVCIILEKVE